MKINLRNKKITIVIISTLLLIVAIGGATLAYLKSNTNKLTNTFTVARVETEIVETLSGISKKPYVKNISTNADCIVRVSVTVSPRSEERRVGKECRL